MPVLYPVAPLAEWLPALSFYIVSYEPTEHLIHGRTLRPLCAEEVTEAFEAVLAAAKHYACPFWLLDRRTNPNEQPSRLHNWMQEDYFPRVKSELGHLPQLAFVVTPQEKEGWAQFRYERVEEWNSLLAHVSWFTEEAPARAWLREQSSSHRVLV